MAKKVFSFILVGLLLLSGCCDEDRKESITTSGINDFEHAEVIEKNEYYTTFYLNKKIYCIIYDKNHYVAKVECNLSKLPKLMLTEAGLLKFTLQAGTGNATQWGYYYDITNNCFSDIFHSVYTEYGRKVAFVCENRIIVQDIFAPSVYYYEITEFNKPFSPVATPFVSIEFTEKGKQLNVMYLSGKNYEKVSEQFVLSE